MNLVCKPKFMYSQGRVPLPSIQAQISLSFSSGSGGLMEEDVVCFSLILTLRALWDLSLMEEGFSNAGPASSSRSGLQEAQPRKDLKTEA